MAADAKTEMREMLGLVPGFLASLPSPPLLDSERDSLRAFPALPQGIFPLSSGNWQR
jgi:hypothetical protein